MKIFTASQKLDAIRFYKINIEHKIRHHVDIDTMEKFSTMYVVLSPENGKSYGLLEKYMFPTDDISEALDIFLEHVTLQKETK